MRHSRTRLAVFGIIMLGAGLWSTAADAQATRTWVSGVGDDANPCSRTAPCKTFAGAISKTAAGGEINCLDPGGFGAVTITKSITISCAYTEGGVLAAGNGIIVNAGATDIVVLRGLDIFGVPTPTNGVRFIAGAALHIEDSVVRRFNAANSAGILFAPSTAGAELYVTNTIVTDNGNGSTGGGIVIAPTGTGSVRAALRGVHVHNNANFGVRVDTAGTTAAAGAHVTIDDSQMFGNSTGLSSNAPASGVVVTLVVTNSTIANNSGTGVQSTGVSSTVLAGNTTITGNATGVSASGGAVIQSFGDNRLQGNPNFLAANNGAFNLPLIPKN